MTNRVHKKSKSLNSDAHSRKATSCRVHASLLLIYFSIALVLFFNKSTTLLTHIHHMVLLDSQVSVCCTCACLVSLFLTILCEISRMPTRALGISLLILILVSAHHFSKLHHFQACYTFSGPHKASPDLLQRPPNWFLCHHLSQWRSSPCTVIMSCFRQQNTIIRQLPLTEKWSSNPLE